MSLIVHSIIDQLYFPEKYKLWYREGVNPKLSKMYFNFNPGDISNSNLLLDGLG